MRTHGKIHRALMIAILAVGLPLASWGEPAGALKPAPTVRSSFVSVRSAFEKQLARLHFPRPLVASAPASTRWSEGAGDNAPADEEVSSAPPIERGDGWLLLRIRSLLLLKPKVSSAQTDVTVRDGVVILRGMAASELQKDLTETYVRGVEGVKAVRNEIAVMPRTASESGAE